MTSPAFVFVELASEHDNQVRLFEDLARRVREAGGRVYAFGPAGAVSCLEPGSVAAGMLVARWPSRAAAEAAATNAVLPALRAALQGMGTHAPVPLVLVANGLPDEGLPDLPDIPTAASVPVPPQLPRNSVMVIRGSASDPKRMEGYRDIILPMMKERGALYEAFALQPGEVTAVSGAWNDQIFAISRWPQLASALDFWYADRYQQQAIPIRIGAGRFTVHVLAAAD